MRKLATLFLLVFFANTLTGYSLFMLSIENGTVFTERYDLNHVIKACCSSPESDPGKIKPLYSFSDHRHPSHRHIQLIKYVIPENPYFYGIAGGFSSIDFWSSYPAFSRSHLANPSSELSNLARQLKLPITPLLQASVLLI